jgi:hypothetical protein
MAKEMTSCRPPKSETEKSNESQMDLINRIECAIRHIQTATDVDPWAQNLAVESMRMRIALMKGKQPDIIHCRECIHAIKDGLFGGLWCNGKAVTGYHYCGYAERKGG